MYFPVHSGPLITKIPLDPKVQALLDKGEPIFDQPETFSPVIGKFHEIQDCTSPSIQTWLRNSTCFLSEVTTINFIDF